MVPSAFLQSQTAASHILGNMGSPALLELSWSDAKAAKHTVQTKFFSSLLLRAAYEISNNSILEHL